VYVQIFYSFWETAAPRLPAIPPILSLDPPLRSQAPCWCKGGLFLGVRDRDVREENAGGVRKEGGYGIALSPSLF